MGRFRCLLGCLVVFPASDAHVGRMLYAVAIYLYTYYAMAIYIYIYVCVQDLSLEGCVHLSGAEAMLFASGLPHLLLLDLTSIKVQDGHLTLLQPLTRLHALRMRRQVSAAAVAKMAAVSAAPVWAALTVCAQPRRWIASAGGPWAPFLSRVWKTPVLC